MVLHMHGTHTHVVGDRVEDGKEVSHVFQREDRVEHFALFAMMVSYRAQSETLVFQFQRTFKDENGSTQC